MPHRSWPQWRERARGRAGRRAALAVGASLAGAGLVSQLLLSTLASPAPAALVTRTQGQLMRTASGGWVVKDLWSPPGPTVNIAYGYQRGYDAGPPLLRSWMEEESLWIRAWPTGAAGEITPEPTPPELRAILTGLAPAVLGDPRVAGPTVTAHVHSVRRVHWRGVAGWWSSALVWAGLPLAGLGAAAEIAANRRSPLVANGVCPRCRYGVRGLDVDRCPECGEPFSTYEQTIIAALIPDEPAAHA